MIILLSYFTDPAKPIANVVLFVVIYVTPLVATKIALLVTKNATEGAFTRFVTIIAGKNVDLVRKNAPFLVVIIYVLISVIMRKSVVLNQTFKLTGVKLCLVVVINVTI